MPYNLYGQHCVFIWNSSSNSSVTSVWQLNFSNILSAYILYTINFQRKTFYFLYYLMCGKNSISSSKTVRAIITAYCLLYSRIVHDDDDDLVLLVYKCIKVYLCTSEYIYNCNQTYIFCNK